MCVALCASPCEAGSSGGGTMNKQHQDLIDKVNAGTLAVHAVKEFDATCLPQWTGVGEWICACDECMPVCESS